jgi:hypothetical protein
MFASEGKSVHVVAYGNGYGCEVHVGEYGNGNTAVTLVAETRDEDGVFTEPLCCLSVNFGDVLPSGHFYLKDWSENAPIVGNERQRVDGEMRRARAILLWVRRLSLLRSEVENRSRNAVVVAPSVGRRRRLSLCLFPAGSVLPRDAKCNKCLNISN